MEQREEATNEHESLKAAGEAMKEVASAMRESIASPQKGPFTSFTVRLTPAKQRELVQAALDLTRKAVPEAQAALDAAMLKPDVPEPTQGGGMGAGYYGRPSKGYEERARLATLQARESQYQFTLDHLADGDVVTSADHAWGWLHPDAPLSQTVPGRYSR